MWTVNSSKRKSQYNEAKIAPRHDAIPCGQWIVQITHSQYNEAKIATRGDVNSELTNIETLEPTTYFCLSRNKRFNGPLHKDCVHTPFTMNTSYGQPTQNQKSLNVVTYLPFLAGLVTSISEWVRPQCLAAVLPRRKINKPKVK